jgi:hypothetical protein
MDVLTRFVTLIAILALAAVVLFRSPSDYRTAVSIIGSLATTAVSVPSRIRGKPMWALVFLAAPGIFTSFQRRFSHLPTGILDRAELQFISASPLIPRRHTMTAVSSAPAGSV